MHLNLNSHVWLVTAALDSTALGISEHQIVTELI